MIICSIRKETESRFDKVEQQLRLKNECFTNSYITNSRSPNFISNQKPTASEFVIYWNNVNRGISGVQWQILHRIGQPQQHFWFLDGYRSSFFTCKALSRIWSSIAVFDTDIQHSIVGFNKVKTLTDNTKIIFFWFLFKNMLKLANHIIWKCWLTSAAR